MRPTPEQVGNRSPAVRNTVERGAVRRFAEAVGDLNPLYLNEKAAARGRWGRLIAPPTFPRVWDFGSVEGVEMPSAGVIHGEQSYEYTRPLFVGEELSCYSVLEDVYEKEGKGGVMTFVVFRRVGEDDVGGEVFSSKEVYILTEAVLEKAER